MDERRFCRVHIENLYYFIVEEANIKVMLYFNYKRIYFVIISH